MDKDNTHKSLTKIIEGFKDINNTLSKIKNSQIIRDDSGKTELLRTTIIKGYEQLSGSTYDSKGNKYKIRITKETN
jgi:hypothetical protein